MNKILQVQFLAAFALLAGLVACTNDGSDRHSAARPNIVILYIDDLGYGDIGSYGAVGIETPNIDRLAANGIRFSDAHSSAATCTPSRYSLLTGEHGFRVAADILEGDAPLLIRPGKPTLATMLKRAGYATGVVGKWHLGLGDGELDWNGDLKEPLKTSRSPPVGKAFATEVAPTTIESNVGATLVANGPTPGTLVRKTLRFLEVPLSPGPLDIGFDYAFLLPATGDRVPAVYVENRKVVGLDSDDPIAISYSGKVGDRPTGYGNPELLRSAADPQHSDTIINGVSRIGHMGGGESALWVDEEFPDIFTARAVQFMRAHRDEPFFLFHSFHDIHVPRLPHPRFEGKSTLGPRGDAIAQVDWMVGEIVAELESLGVAENTLVIFTSDNGPVLDDGYADQAIVAATYR